MNDPRNRKEDQDQGSKGGQAGMEQEETTDQTNQNQSDTGFGDTGMVESEEEDTELP